jgi:hypothetical protein
MLTRLGRSSTKTLGAIAVAILLTSGAAMANDSGENHQDNTNATGPNPFMSLSGRSYRGGYQSFAEYPVHHHVVNHHVKK